MDLQSFLNAKIKEQGLSLKKLSDLTGIALKHLENINSGNFDELPAAPYLHGYFIKLGQALNFDGEELWRHFKSEAEITTSGAKDELPKNRFLKKSPAKKVWLGVLVLIIASYFGIRFSKILGQPSLVIFYPEESLVSVSSSEITVRGSLAEGDKLTLNNEEVPVSAEGLWFKNFPLEPGLNVIEIRAKKFLGRETKVTRQVSYEPTLNINVPTSTEATPAEEP